MMNRRLGIGRKGGIGGRSAQQVQRHFDRFVVLLFRRHVGLRAGFLGTLGLELVQALERPCLSIQVRKDAHLCAQDFGNDRHGYVVDSAALIAAQPVEIARPFGFPITNSMVVTWIVAIGLIVFAQAATRKMREVPGGAQNLANQVSGAVNASYSCVQGGLAGTGKAHGDHVRFTKTQAGVLDALLAAQPLSSFDETFARISAELRSFSSVTIA